MLPNPSHLETVDPLVSGKARAKMDYLGDSKGARVLPIMVHGDGAFTGQGVVYETIQMEKLEGYGTGGTVHVLFNNQLGFTANPRDGRSSTYPTDLMKTIGSLVIHVNADHPELVDQASKIAVEFRMKFSRDVIVNIIGYRRHGHNEHDSPKFTQPVLYGLIDKQLPMWKQYAAKLVKEGLFTQQEIDAKYKGFLNRILESYERSKDGKYVESERPSLLWGPFLKPSSECTQPEGKPTNVSEKVFKEVGTKINTIPTENRAFHPLALKVYEARLQAIEAGKGLDWGCAEALAFGTLMNEGFGVRLSGEDVKRGTFSQRHGVLFDQSNGSTYTPLNVLNGHKETPYMFRTFNSFLSEYGVVGFDYGYSTANPNYLTMWEAQFGDFANVAQPIIDTYITNAEAKWGLKSGFVMLLPHGQDGLGPEHSSARVERYLQMLDDDIYDPDFIKNDNRQLRLVNYHICNLTDPANYFHILRRQLHRDFRKPLILLTPKRLLRLKDVSQK